MLFGQTEHYLICPYCNAEISILVETQNGNHEYIEDCEVCCNPIKFSLVINQNTLVDFSAATLDE